MGDYEDPQCSVRVESCNPTSSLEERVAKLELENVTLKAEFGSYRATSEATITALNTMMEAFKMQMQMMSTKI